MARKKIAFRPSAASRLTKLGDRKMLDIETIVISTIQSEWPKNIPDALVFYTYKIDKIKKRVDLCVDFTEAVIDTTKEPFWEIEGILATHLDDDWMVATEFAVRPNGHRLEPGEVVWFPERTTS
jgi:hypothetical protein